MRRHSKIKDQSGVSIIIAMVFFMVITLACLTLFRVASGAIKEAQRYADAQKADILSSSMSIVVQDMIENGVAEGEESPGVHYTSDKLALYKDNDGHLLTDGKELLESKYIDDNKMVKNPISDYILKNLKYSQWTTSDWRYYDEELSDIMDKSQLTRTLKLTGLEEQDATGEISMYWTWDNASASKLDFESRKLYVTVTIYVGEEKASNTSVFVTERAYEYQYSDEIDGKKLTDRYYWWKYDGEMR